MTEEDESDSSTDSSAREDAKRILLDIAGRPSVREEYPLVAEICGPEQMEQIIGMAWRYQFVASRMDFKRAIQKVEEYVLLRAKEMEEEGE